MSKTLDRFGLFNTFVGGAFEKASLFSLGIMPYISSSIIIQLMGSVVPYFQRLQKEGEAGRKKITQITRYGTVFLATMQSYGVVAVFLPSLTDNGTGDFTHNFTNSMGNDDFALTAGSNGTSIDGVNSYAMYYDGGDATTSSVTSRHFEDTGTNLDVKYIMGMVAGDLA